MTPTTNSVALTADLHDEAVSFLMRADGQEDICFALWLPSTGKARRTALLQKLILPLDGDRELHGNVSFTPQFLQRALSVAMKEKMGLALMHSHPIGRGWQRMSNDDIVAEQSNAGTVFGATEMPFLGLTLAGLDHAWSARFWDRTAPKVYAGNWCRNVRVVGERLSVSFHPGLAPAPAVTKEQVRTVSAWGEERQADLARLKFGVVGGGSTGGFIAEALARGGATDIVLADPDKISSHNLDRLVYATKSDVGKFKVEVLATRIRTIATAESINVVELREYVYMKDTQLELLDCDVIFCCVDRPWGRQVLNHIAYEHFVPVVDGGILVTTRKGKLISADWTAQVVGPAHRCLACLGQYATWAVQLEIEGKLDDPKYIEGLDDSNPLKARQNVFTFSMACASMQMMQMLNMIVDPCERAYTGAQRYHFVGGGMEPNNYKPCEDGCALRESTGRGDLAPYSVTAAPGFVPPHQAAAKAELESPRSGHGH